jgi:hypothetical protein
MFILAEAKLMVAVVFNRSGQKIILRPPPTALVRGVRVRGYSKHPWCPFRRKHRTNIDMV